MVESKQEKESFVSGHEGTTPAELLLVCCTVPVGLWCGSILLSRFTFLRSRPLSLEASVFWIPMILCQSIYLYPWGVSYLAVEIVVAVVLDIIWKKNDSTTSEETLQQQAAVKASNKKKNSNGSLTTYRSSMMYLTFTAILAVDFHFFPRRFVKTETEGYSLMDLGAASFVIAAGLVSPKARQGTSKRQTKKSGLFTLRDIRRMAPLVIMGVLRLVTHKGIEYQEHASEYGIHWNFFFTLAFLHAVVPFLPGPSNVLPLLLMSLYQAFLSYGGGQEWIEGGSRKCAPLPSGSEPSPFCHVFASNREGILGCIGYVSIYMISEWIGSIALWPSSANDEVPRNGLFWAVCVVLGCVWRLLVYFGIKVSRRSTNVSFCCWALVVNLLILQLVRTVHQRNGQVSMVSNALNRHGLTCFVVANLLTGAVNLSINTLEIQDLTAMVILVAYMTSIGVLAIALETVSDSLQHRKDKIAKTE